MATVYPAALDNFINPTPTDTLNSTTVPHAKQHADLNDAVEAIETILGINPSGIHPTVEYRIGVAELAINTQSVLNGLTDVTIGTANTGDVLRYNGTAWVNYNEESLVDGGNF